MEDIQKIKIGWFSFSCCEDSTIVFTELLNDHWQAWKQLFDFRHVKVLKSHNIMDEFDIAFIEGAIASEEQAEKVKHIRSISKKVLAIGACACTALPSGQRNNFTPEQKEATEWLVERFKGLPQVLKLEDVITVDAKVPGCPMDPKKFLEAVNALVAEMRPELMKTPA